MRRPVSERRRDGTPLNIFSESVQMPEVTRNGSFEKTVQMDESQIAGRLGELLEHTRSKGYVHTARMIEEALSAHSFERRHLGNTQKYLSELQRLKRKEMTRLVRETDGKKQAAFVLTPRMRVDHRNPAALRSGVWRNTPMPFLAEPEFKFR